MGKALESLRERHARRALERATEDAACLIERRLFLHWTRTEGVSPGELATRVDASAKDRAMGRTLLAWAAKSGDAEAVAALAPISDVEARDNEGATPLILAAVSCSPEAVGALLRAGALPGACDRDGWTPLMWAAAGGDIATIHLLAERGGADARSADGATALMLAALRRGAAGPHACEALLPVASLHAQDRWGRTALDCARCSGNFDAAAMLERAELAGFEGVAARPRPAR